MIERHLISAFDNKIRCIWVYRRPHSLCSASSRHAGQPSGSVALLLIKKSKDWTRTLRDSSIAKNFKISVALFWTENSLGTIKRSSVIVWPLEYRLDLHNTTALESPPMGT